MPTLRYSATLRLCVKTQCSTFLQRRGAKTRRYAEISLESFSTFIRHNRSRRFKYNFTYTILMHIQSFSAVLCAIATLR